MHVKQLSIFLENAKGSLLKLTKLFGEAGIDLVALSIADTEQYGIVRCIVSDAVKAAAVVREAGYSMRQTDVLAACVPDAPGGLAKVLQMLSDADISVEYLYSLVRAKGDSAAVIFQLADLDKGIALLKAGGIELLNSEQLHAL